MVIDRIFTRIEETSYSHITGSCWSWTGAKAQGYGRISVNNKLHQVHRIVYEWYYNKILGDLHIDHLCMNRSCCNPLHLEAVTQKVNNSFNRQRKQSKWLKCLKGHRVDTLQSRTSSGKCRECKNIINKKYMRRIRKIKKGLVA